MLNAAKLVGHVHSPLVLLSLTESLFTLALATAAEARVVFTEEGTVGGAGKCGRCWK